MNVKNLVGYITTLVIGVVLVVGVLSPMISQALDEGKEKYVNDEGAGVFLTETAPENTAISMIYEMDEVDDTKIVKATVQSGDYSAELRSGISTVFACDPCIIAIKVSGTTELTVQAYMLYFTDDVYTATIDTPTTISVDVSDTLTVTMQNGIDTDVAQTVALPEKAYMLSENGMYDTYKMSDTVHADSTPMIAYNDSGDLLLNTHSEYGEGVMGSVITDDVLESVTLTVDDTAYVYDTILYLKEITIGEGLFSPTLASLVSLLPLLIIAGLVIGMITIYGRS